MSDNKIKLNPDTQKIDFSLTSYDELVAFVKPIFDGLFKTLNAQIEEFFIKLKFKNGFKVGYTQFEDFWTRSIITLMMHKRSADPDTFIMHMIKTNKELLNITPDPERLRELKEDIVFLETLLPDTPDEPTPSDTTPATPIIRINEENGNSICPYCQREFLQINRHLPSCKSNPKR